MIERIILHSKTQISLNERFQRISNERGDKRRVNRGRGGGGTGGYESRILSNPLTGTYRGRIDKRRGGRAAAVSGALNGPSRVVTVETVPSSLVSRGRGNTTAPRGRGYGRPIRLDGGALLFMPRGGARTPRYSNLRGQMVDESLIQEREVVLGSPKRGRGRGGGLFRGGSARNYRGGGSYRGH